MSEVKVNKISPRTACGTVTLGDSGDAFTIPSGVTITNNGTQVGFGRTGTVDWQTGSIKTAGFTAATGEGYFCNTIGGIFTVALPAGAAGSIVSLADYSGTWNINNLTVSPNGSEKIGGTNVNAILATEGQSVTLVYVDSTQGWVNTMDSTSNVRGLSPFVHATGGAVSLDGDYKIHTFTGPGTFEVTSLNPSAPGNAVDWLVAAGGGGGGGRHGGGAGAGGYRESPGTATGCYTASPIAGGSAVTVTVSEYPITVGSGGTAGNRTPDSAGTNGSDSSFSSYTSTGGGRGHTYLSSAAQVGGSGGGGGHPATPGIGVCGAAGNTPPTSPAQGTAGGAAGGPGYSGGGGGGATAAGTGGSACGGAGGVGGTSSINGTPTQRSGGGGGGMYCATGTNPGTATGGGGAGGGGPPGSPTAATAGTANTGGGGGGYGGTNPGNPSPNCTGANGGSGVVIVRYKYQ